MTDNTTNNHSSAEMLNFFTAENLLTGSPILSEVLRLRDQLSRASDGTIVDYDTMLLRIQNEVDDLPTLTLQLNIPSGSEGAYQRQLLHALEKINDDHDRVYRKLIKLKTRLLNAQSLMKSQRSQFAAFYSLAIPIAIKALSIPKLTVSAPHVKEMAEAEFSRLMDNLDKSVISLLSELSILEMKAKSSKIAQAAKYSLGKDQVNAMWNSFQPTGNIGVDDDPTLLLNKFPVDEEDGDEVPAYVSRHSKEVRVAASQSLILTKPEVIPKSPRFTLEEEGEVEGFIKGTFVKTGDPKPITPVLEEGSVFAAVHEAAEGLHKAGMIDDTTMLEFDQECLTPKDILVTLKPMSTKVLLIEDIDTPSATTGEHVRSEEPRRIISPEEMDAILNDPFPTPVATPSFSTPRKKLLLDDEEF